MSKDKRVLDSLVRGISTAYGMSAANNANQIIEEMADSLHEADKSIDGELTAIKNAKNAEEATEAYEKILMSVNQAASDTIHAKSEYEKAVEIYDKAIERSEAVYTDEKLTGEGHGFDTIEEAASEASKRATEAAATLDSMDRDSNVSIDYYYTAKAVSTYVPTKALELMDDDNKSTGLIHTVDGRPVYVMRSERAGGLTTVTYAEITEARAVAEVLGYSKDTPVSEINETILEKTGLSGNILVGAMTRVDQTEEKSVSYICFGYVDTTEISVDITREIKIGTDSANDALIRQEAAQELLNTASERYRDSESEGYSILKTDIKTQVGYNYDIRYKKYTRIGNEDDSEYMSRDIEQAALNLNRASMAFDSIREKLEMAREMLEEYH